MSRSLLDHGLRTGYDECAELRAALAAERKLTEEAVRAAYDHGVLVGRSRHIDGKEIDADAAFDIWLTRYTASRTPETEASMTSGE